MLTSLDSLRLAALCACLPSRIIANEAKIAQTTGIAARRIAAEGTTVVDLCVRAAEKAITDARATPSDFGAIVFVSFTHACHMPSSAAQAQARLGLPKDLIAFDISLACSGWGYGLYLAGLLARQTGKKVLLLDGDVQSAFLDSKDVKTASLLSDGGTAAIIETGFDSWRFSFATEGEKGGALKLEEGGTITMDGFSVFQFVATDVVQHIKNFLSATSNLQPSISNLTFVPHQPNVYMVRQLAKILDIDEAKTALSCDRFGNLSSASVPVTIAANDVRGPVLFAGFGGGLSISVGAINVPDDCALSLLEV